MDNIAEKYPNVFLTRPLVNLLDCEEPKSKLRVVAQLSPQIVRDNDINMAQDEDKQPMLSAKPQIEKKIGIPSGYSDNQIFDGFDAWDSDLL